MHLSIVVSAHKYGIILLHYPYGEQKLILPLTIKFRLTMKHAKEQTTFYQLLPCEQYLYHCYK